MTIRQSIQLAIADLANEALDGDTEGLEKAAEQRQQFLNDTADATNWRFQNALLDSPHLAHLVESHECVHIDGLKVHFEGYDGEKILRTGCTTEPNSVLKLNLSVNLKAKE